MIQTIQCLSSDPGDNCFSKKLLEKVTRRTDRIKKMKFLKNLHVINYVPLHCSLCGKGSRQQVFSPSLIIILQQVLVGQIKQINSIDSNFCMRALLRNATYLYLNLRRKKKVYYIVVKLVIASIVNNYSNYFFFLPSNFLNIISFRKIVHFYLFFVLRLLI